MFVKNAGEAIWSFVVVTSQSVSCVGHEISGDCSLVTMIFEYVYKLPHGNPQLVFAGVG